jgi:8-oxo-dGTP diphosphatase
MTNGIGRFMVAVGALIENTQTGKILLMKRSPQKDYAPSVWEIVTGRMENFEGVEQALKREVKEETGLDDITIIKPIRISTFFRGEKVAEKEVVVTTFHCQSKSDTVTISDEHSECKWVTPQEALEIVKNFDDFSVADDIKAFIEGKN